MHDFQNKSQDEEVVLTFDFDPQMAEGSTIFAVVDVVPQVKSGSDPYVAAMIVDDPVLSGDQRQVLQSCVGGVNGVNYLITCRVRADAADGEILELAGTLRVRKAT